MTQAIVRGLLPQGFFQWLKIVIWQRQGISDNFFRHPRTSRNTEGQEPGPCLDQEGIGMSMITPVEFDDHFPTGIAPGQTYRAHCRLGPGIDEAYLLDRGQGLDHHRGQLNLGRRGGTETGAVDRGRMNGPDDGGVGMSEDHRSPGTDKVKVLISVYIEDRCPLRPLDEDRIATHRSAGPDRAVYPSGDYPSGLFEHLFG